MEKIINFSYFKISTVTLISLQLHSS